MVIVLNYIIEQLHKQPQKSSESLMNISLKQLLHDGLQLRIIFSVNHLVCEVSEIIGKAAQFPSSFSYCRWAHDTVYNRIMTCTCSPHHAALIGACCS